MWLISLLPDWIIHVATLGSVMLLLASQFLGNLIPVLYRAPAQIVAALLLIFCVYLEGGITNEDKWQLKVEEQKAEIAQLQTKQSDTTIEVVTKYVDRIRVVKEKQNVLIKEVPKYITQTDNAHCVLPDAVRLLHDAAATGESFIPPAAGNADDSSSTAKETGKK